MRWSSDCLAIPTTMLEAALGHFLVKPVCACGHSSMFDPHGLWWHFRQRHWDDRVYSCAGALLVSGLPVEHQAARSTDSHRLRALGGRGWLPTTSAAL